MSDSGTAPSPTGSTTSTASIASKTRAAEAAAGAWAVEVTFGATTLSLKGSHSKRRRIAPTVGT